MKSCPYCGKQYPDDATVCEIDGESLSVPVEFRKKVTGVWRGVYGYAETGGLGLKPVKFTLKLEQGWLEHFTGKVTEDAPDGMPETGVIDGYHQSPTVEFTKQMPVGYVVDPEGRRMTIRQYVIAQGHECETEIPSAPIFYQGTFLDKNRVQGTWIIKPHKIPLPGGWSMSLGETSGIWCAEFVTTDIQANSTGGPIEPYFDKSFLALPQDPERSGPQDAPTLRSLGKFNVADAEDILKKFEKAGLWFEINRDDGPMRQMSPITAAMGGFSGTASLIEIFVNPEDEARAVELMG